MQGRPLSKRFCEFAQRCAPYAAILGVSVWLMAGWLWREGLPNSPRQEVITELAITWMFRQELLDGHLLSEWNPLWFSGFPWLRFLSYSVYYGIAAVALLTRLPLETMMVLFFLAVLVGSGWVMYGFLSRLVGDWRAALVGALLYVAFPYHHHVGAETWMHAAFWVIFPLPFWVTELSHAHPERRTRYMLWLGVVLALFPIVSSEYTIFGTPFVLLYILVYELGGLRRGQRDIVTRLRGYVLAGLVALGLAAFFVLPGLFETNYVGIHAKHGAGTTFSDELIRDYAVTPGLVWYAIARRFGLPADTARLPGLWRIFWSITWYPGIVASGLVILGLIAGRRQRQVWALAVVLALVLLLITGPNFRLNFFTRLPVLGRLTPFRGMLLVVAFVSALAAWGMRWLLARWPRPAIAWALMLGVTLITLGEFKPATGAYQSVTSYFTAQEREAYAWLTERAQGGRLWDVADRPRDMYLRTYALSEVSLPRYMGYYDNGAPLYTWEQMNWGDLLTSLRLHDVRYVLLRKEEPRTPELGALLGGAGYQVAFENAHMLLWEDGVAGGYVRFYPTVALDLLDDRERSREAVAALYRRGAATVAVDSLPAQASPSDAERLRFDYALVSNANQAAAPAYLAQPRASVTLADLDAIQVQPTTRVDAQVWRPAYGDIRLEVAAPAGGLLTIAESWYPYWRVEVDGRPAPVLRANGALLGVMLAPGAYQVRFYYVRPAYVSIGFGITALTLICLVGYGVLSRRSRG